MNWSRDSQKSRGGTNSPSFVNLPLTILCVASILILTTSGCAKIVLKSYGIKKVKQIENSAITKFSKSFELPPFELANNFNTYIKKIELLDSLETVEKSNKNYDYSVIAHDLNQPLQMFIFDDNDSLISYYVNCYAYGFPNLNWNRNKILNSFPPQTLAPVSHLVKRRELLSYVSPNPNSNSKTNDYTLIIFWNKFMLRQSKRLIKEAYQLKKKSTKSIKIILVNNDNYFYSSGFKPY